MQHLPIRHLRTMSAPWREAATIILAAKAPNSSRPGALPFDYKLLMLKRSSRSGFMPSANVFPGGVLDPADQSDEWLSLFQSAGVGLAQLRKFSEISGPRPAAFGGDDSQQDPESESRSRSSSSNSRTLPGEVAFRICAIRETYEESGILLGRRFTRNTAEGNADLKINMDTRDEIKTADHCWLEWSVLDRWQSIVDSDARQFLTMCQQFSILPDIWSLREWFNWLTPTRGVKNKPGDSEAVPRRYDTVFFLCCIDDLLEVAHCQREMVKAEWVSPVDALLDHQDRKVYLPPPQIFTCHGLCNHPRIDSLHRFSISREQHGMERWLPVLIPCKDGIAELWPGDDCYPARPDVYGGKEVDEQIRDLLDVTLQEYREKCSSLNRLELYPNTDSNIVSNCSAYGHAVPFQGELRVPKLHKL